MHCTRNSASNSATLALSIATAAFRTCARSSGCTYSRRWTDEVCVSAARPPSITCQFALSQKSSDSMSQSQIVREEPSSALRTRSRSRASSAMVASRSARPRLNIARATPSSTAATGRIASRNASANGIW